MKLPDANWEFPDPLWEASLTSKRLCLVCARHEAKTVLRGIQEEIIPLCQECSFGWNFYRYQILKRINPLQLITRIIYYKLFRPFSKPSYYTIYQDIRKFQSWVRKMKRWM